MTKSELIDVITSINRSATRDFLAELSRRDLSDYMRRLESVGLLPAKYCIDSPSTRAKYGLTGAANAQPGSA